MTSGAKAYHIRFERRQWPLIEIEAINCFIQTLPQFRIRSTLRKAFEAVTDHYLKSDISPPAQEIASQARTPTTEKRISLMTARISPAAESNILSSNWSLRGSTSETPTATGLSFEDAQAAEVLSSITRTSRIHQSHQTSVSPYRSPPAESLDPVSANWETPPSPPPKDVSQEAVPSSPMAGDGETNWQRSPTLAQWVQDIGNPLSFWQSEPDPLDWGPSFVSEIQNLSNPLPLPDDIPPVHQVDWGHYMVDWSNYMLSGPGNPPPPLDPETMPFPDDNS